MAEYMPNFNHEKTRAVCCDIRNKPKLSHRHDALLNLRKELRISASEEWLGMGVQSEAGEEGLQALQEFANLYAELNNYRRKDIYVIASVFYSLPATRAEVAQWQRLKSKFTAAPYGFTMDPSYIDGRKGTHLDDRLEPITPMETYSNNPGYVLEPYWSDIVKVLETEPVCVIHGHKGVSKQGHPPRYFFTDRPHTQLLGTSDPENNRPLFDFRPCRSLLCPGAHVDKVRKCSRCGQASYCSKQCQKAHWPLHKPHCKAPNRSSA